MQQQPYIIHYGRHGQTVDLTKVPWDRLVKWEDDSDEDSDLSPRTRGVRSTKRDQDIEDILQQV